MGVVGENREIPQADRRILVFNLFILCGTIALLVGANRFFQAKTQNAAIRNNSFLTTEWRLLKEMKEQTDQLIQAKDREIAAIMGQYRELLAGTGSPEEIRAIEEQLRKTEEERERILTLRFPAADSGTSPETLKNDLSNLPAVPVTAVREAVPDTALTVLLRNRIAEMELLAEADRETAERIRAENAQYELELERLRTLPETGEAAALPEGSVPVSAIQEKISSLQDEASPITLAEIKTRTLLRAIIRSPAIQTEYPAMGEDLDRYLERFAAAERLRGAKEAYEEMLTVMEGE